MKLRLAKKIMKAVGTPDQSRYSEHQIGAANRRYLRTESAKEADRFFMGLVRDYWREHPFSQLHDEP